MAQAAAPIGERRHAFAANRDADIAAVEAVLAPDVRARQPHRQRPVPGS